MMVRLWLDFSEILKNVRKNFNKNIHKMKIN